MELVKTGKAVCKNHECNNLITHGHMAYRLKRELVYYCSIKCYLRHKEVVQAGAKERVAKHLEKQNVSKARDEVQEESTAGSKSPSCR